MPNQEKIIGSQYHRVVMDSYHIFVVMAGFGMVDLPYAPIFINLTPILSKTSGKKHPNHIHVF